MIEYVKLNISKGDKRGFPIVEKHEVVPAKDDIYECSPDHTCFYRKSVTKPHKEFLFVRAASLAGAIMYCLNKNHYPCHCKPGDNPTQAHWDNFSTVSMINSDLSMLTASDLSMLTSNCMQVLWPLHAVYCHMQGYARTSDIARLCLLYFFFGTYQWTTKDKDDEVVIREKPVLFGIVKRLMNGRSRFVNGVTTNFKQFIELYEDNPEWEEFLDDKGVGDPPIEYLAAVELGLRQYDIVGIHTMGTRTLRSGVLGLSVLTAIYQC